MSTPMTPKELATMAVGIAQRMAAMGLEPRWAPVPLAISTSPNNVSFHPLADWDGGVEVSRCGYVDDDCVERIDSDDLTGIIGEPFWSVYAHQSVGGVDCIADFASEGPARAFGARLETLWAEGKRTAQDLLVDCVQHGWLQATQAALDAGADLHQADEQGNTVLHRAVMNADRPMTRFLLGWGVDANAQNERGRTALHEAAFLQEERESLSRILIEAGARTDLLDAQGHTPDALFEALDAARRLGVEQPQDHEGAQER